MEGHGAAGLISIIIPCWRGDAVPEELALHWLEHPAVREVLVALAGAGQEEEENTDATNAAAGWRVIRCSTPGRGSQMNAAARIATGEILLFQHADTEISHAHFDSLRATMEADLQVGGGAFRRRFDERHPRLHWIEPWEALRCRRLGPLFGDQSIFVRRSIFKGLGGFADIPLMEDVEFSCRLRRRTKVAILEPAIRSSPRKHLEQGCWRTTTSNGLMLLLYVLGVSPQRLHRWYYRGRPAAVSPALPQSS